MKRPQLNKKAFRRSIWSSLSRLIGTGLSAGAGSLLYHLVGDGSLGWGLAFIMAIISFMLMLLAEYNREIDE